MSNSYVLCDTNIFIHLFKKDKKTIKILHKIDSKNILMPAITVMELFRGMRNKKELTEMIKKIDNYSIFDIDRNTSKLARELIKKYHLSKGMDIPDSLIAASAKNYNLELFTYNTKDFKFITGLRLYKY